VPEQLLTILKVCLLVLIWLFFLRVLRAVWADLGGRVPGRRATRPARTPPASRGPAPAALVVAEPPQLAGQRWTLAPVTTIGRAEAAVVRLEDSFLSQHHARVRHSDGAWILEDLGSTNGTFLNRERIAAAHPIAVGDTIQVGSIVLEVA